MIDIIPLSTFLNKGIIKVKKKETTLFDIAGFPHYENVMSNMYAYFLDPRKPHGLNSLFLDSLLELLDSDLVFESPQIEREYTTLKGGRIDLVIRQKGPDTKKVIIIENKMYHHLHNDLKDYYDTFADFERLGVLLTINPTVVHHDKFVNITHKQLLDKVLQNLGRMILNVPDQSLFLLKEFSRNLNNFNMSHEVGKYFDFYLSNRNNIAEVEKLSNELRNHIWTHIDLVPELLTDLKLTLASKSSDRLRYYVSNKTSDVFFTVFPRLLNKDQPYIGIVIELNKAGIKRLEEINTIIFTEEEKLFLHETTNQRNGWLHYARRNFDVSSGDFMNLGSFIKDKIETTPLKSIFLKMEALLASK